MFQEVKAKRSPLQIVGIVVIFILAVLIILTFVLFGMFKNSNSAPKLFGYRVYVVDNNRMEPRIPNGSAVFVEEGSLPDPSSQSVILCRIDEQLWVIGFVGTDVTESGETRYLVKYDNATDDKTWGIKQSDIIGVARTQDKFFGSVIRFASSKVGMMAIVIIPCLIVIIYEVIMLLISLRGVEREGQHARSESSSNTNKSIVTETVDTAKKLIGVGLDSEDIPPEREDIQLPIDTEKEERYVEKQLRRANDSLSTTIHESEIKTGSQEIKLDDLHVNTEQDKVGEDLRDSSLNIDPIDIDSDPLFKLPKKESTSRPAFIYPDPINSKETAPEPTHETPVKEIEPKPSYIRKGMENAPEPKASEDKPLSIEDLSPSRIDELIKLLEEEKKRLEDK